MRTETDKAYIAGIVDGEGCITVYEYKHSGYVKPLVNVTNTYKPLLVWLQQEYGGSVSRQTNVSSVYNKPCWRWQLWGCSKILPFLRELNPFLQIKKQQAEAILNCQRFLDIEKLGNDHKLVKKLTVLQQKESAILLKKIRKLNGKKSKSSKIRDKEIT